jgi:hypothetical protein
MTWEYFKRRQNSHKGRDANLVKSSGDESSPHRHCAWPRYKPTLRMVSPRLSYLRHRKVQEAPFSRKAGNQTRPVANMSWVATETSLNAHCPRKAGKLNYGPSLKPANNKMAV